MACVAEQTSEYRVEPARIPTTTIPAAVIDVDPLEHAWAPGAAPRGGEARPEANGTDRAGRRSDPRASDRDGSRIDPGTGPDAEPDGHVGWHVEELAGLLGDRDGLARMDAAAVQARIRHLRRLSGLADAALAAAVAALDRVGGVAADGAASKAEWLKANTGRSGRDAARMERLANNLECLPATAQALATGGCRPRRRMPWSAPPGTAVWGRRTESRRTCCRLPRTARPNTCDATSGPGSNRRTSGRSCGTRNGNAHAAGCPGPVRTTACGTWAGASPARSATSSRR